MQNRWKASIVAVAVVTFLSAGFAQTPARPGAARSTPNLAGVWMPSDIGQHRRFSPEDAPLQPWALEIYKVNREGITDRSLQGLPHLDPFMYCLPSGMPRAYTAPLPFEIVQLPERLYMIFQTTPLVRYIYADGREHPEGYPSTFMGHSIGKWDGDTLVVDTVALDETAWLDTAGTPHSDALRIVERIRRPNQTTLQIDFLFEDPKAYTKPWTGKKVFKLEATWEMIPGVICEDRFRADFARRSLRDKKDWIEFVK